MANSPEEQKHYRDATRAEDEGYNDGYEGRPDRTAELGGMGHYYGGGYESGAADRRVEQTR